MTPAAWVSLCCLFLVGAGCSIAPKRQQTDVRVHAESDISASFEQARLRVRALVQPMSSVIVASADQILAGTSDPAIRREALRWKIDAVPALREALFQPNPMTAVGDAWVLTFQMTDYFEQGPGAKALGPARGIAVTTSQRLEAEMARVAASLTVSGDVSERGSSSGNGRQTIRCGSPSPGVSPSCDTRWSGSGPPRSPPRTPRAT